MAPARGVYGQEITPRPASHTSLDVIKAAPVQAVSAFRPSYKGVRELREARLSVRRRVYTVEKGPLHGGMTVGYR